MYHREIRLIPWLLAWPAVLLMGACATVPRDLVPPKVHLASITPKAATLLEQRFDVQLRVQNPNETDLGIDGLRFALELNDREFATGLSPRKVTVPRLGSELLDVEVITGLGSVLRQLNELHGDGLNKFRYRIKGTVFVEVPGRFKLPFDEQGEIDFHLDKQ